MYIYELVYTDGGTVDHEIITAETEDDAHAQWDDHREGHEELLGIESHGKFRTSEIFEEIRQELVDRGVPEGYQN